MNAKDLNLEDIQVGQAASFERTFTEADVQAFAELSGDTNPLHMDPAYAGSTKFGQRLVHGMLIASLCSALVGMYIPGKKCLYLGQTLSFKRPVFIGDTVTVTGRVESVSSSTRIVSIEINITKQGEDAVTGVATTQVL